MPPLAAQRHTDGVPGPEGWYPEQGLAVSEAVYAYTVGAALAAGRPDRLGSLLPGKLADLVVLDRDLGHIGPKEILQTRPLGTMIGGQWSYRQDELG